MRGIWENDFRVGEFHREFMFISLWKGLIYADGVNAKSGAAGVRNDFHFRDAVIKRPGPSISRASGISLEESGAHEITNRDPGDKRKCILGEFSRITN
ncbi:hypothetical protein TNCV_83211 [Trichonephila clavipes]|nr:hypothetical protein TNCV_83211 [Trichonephila clavipes]